MRLPQTGGCQCGAIRYEIREAPHLVYSCHCKECQRLTGRAFSMALVVPAAASQLAGTQPRPLQRKADSGRTVTQWVCPDCGTWIWSGPKPDRQTETQFASAPARWTTLLGCVRQCISGPAARTPGSCCPRAIGGSRRSRTTWPGCEPARRETVELGRRLEHWTE